MLAEAIVVPFHCPHELLESDWVSESGYFEFLMIAWPTGTGRVDVHRRQNIRDAETGVSSWLLDITVGYFIVGYRLAAPSGIGARQAPARLASVADEADAISGEGDVLHLQEGKGVVNGGG